VAKTHIGYLKGQVLPDAYVVQVHASMAVCNAKRWDFFSYHPELPPLYLKVFRDEFTEQLLAGLLEFAEDFKRQQTWIADLWDSRKGAA